MTSTRHYDPRSKIMLQYFGILRTMGNYCGNKFNLPAPKKYFCFEKNDKIN